MEVYLGADSHTQPIFFESFGVWTCAGRITHLLMHRQFQFCKLYVESLW